MNLKLLLIIVGSILSCNQKEEKIVIKKISNDDITIKWYYYSHITNNSPDIVEVEKRSTRKEVYKAEGIISNVTLNEHNIIIKLVEPENGIVYTKDVNKELFGYKIVLDSTGTFDEYRLKPKGIKEGGSLGF